MENCKPRMELARVKRIFHIRGQVKKKRRQNEDQISESDKALFNMLQAQQVSIRQSEERDKVAIEAMMIFQANSERRHQEFIVSVLGELGYIFFF